MNAFEIIGGKKLKGEIHPQGAKNEALQILAAVLLTEEKITISNIPDIKDVNKLIELLGDLGVVVERLSKDTYTFQAKDINLDYFLSDTFKAKGGGLRGSIMIVGPLLGRFGKAAIPKPGGDKIGRRTSEFSACKRYFVRIGKYIDFNREKEKQNICDNAG